MKTNLTQMLPATRCTKYLVLHNYFGRKMVKKTNSTLDMSISQGSVATQLKCGRIVLQQSSCREQW